MTRAPLSEAEVHGLLELDPAIPAEAADIDTIRAIVAKIPALPAELVFGPLMEEHLEP